MIVLDTSVLSLVFRRRTGVGADPPAARALRRMIVDDWPLGIPGVVLQELLSGVRTPSQFRALQVDLQGFPILLADEIHHVRAAEVSNACRRAGVACSAVDALIAATTILAGGQLLTVDKDFQRIAGCCGLMLFSLTSTPQ